MLIYGAVGFEPCGRLLYGAMSSAASTSSGAATADCWIDVEIKVVFDENDDSPYDDNGSYVGDGCIARFEFHSHGMFVSLCCHDLSGVVMWRTLRDSDGFVKVFGRDESNSLTSITLQNGVISFHVLHSVTRGFVNIVVPRARCVAAIDKVIAALEARLAKATDEEPS